MCTTQAMNDSGYNIISWLIFTPVVYWGYPLVNVYIAMERSTMLLMGKLTISMAIFNSYFDITRGYIPLNPMENPIKPPFSYGFPMVFPVVYWTSPT